MSYPHPNTQHPPSINSPASLNPSTIIGYKVSLETTLGEKHEGVVFAYDSVTGFIALSGCKGRPNARVLLRTSSICKAIVLETNVGKNVNDNLPAINLASVVEREQQNIKRLREESSRIGVGVTAEAQFIFDALSKTLPCRWEGIDIVVYDDIVDIHIVKPYTSSDCSAKGGGDEVEGRLSYIKRVLEGERRKLFRS